MQEGTIIHLHLKPISPQSQSMPPQQSPLSTRPLQKCLRENGHKYPMPCKGSHSTCLPMFPSVHIAARRVPPRRISEVTIQTGRSSILSTTASAPPPTCQIQGKTTLAAASIDTTSIAKLEVQFWVGSSQPGCVKGICRPGQSPEQYYDVALVGQRQRRRLG